MDIQQIERSLLGSLLALKQVDKSTLKLISQVHTTDFTDELTRHAIKLIRDDLSNCNAMILSDKLSEPLNHYNHGDLIATLTEIEKDNIYSNQERILETVSHRAKAIREEVINKRISHIASSIASATHENAKAMAHEINSLIEEKSRGEKPGLTLDKFSLSLEAIEESLMLLKDAKYIFSKLVMMTQITTFFAPPNAGKTLTTIKLLIDDIKRGNLNGSDVFYINADDGGTGAMTKAKMLSSLGVNCVVTGANDFKPSDLVTALNDMINSDLANNKIIILDTYKKFVDVIDKKSLAKFNTVLRSFTVAGGTVIILAHVNKNKDAHGNLVAGGTSDAMDDIDCAYFLQSSDDLKTKYMNFTRAKTRGDNVEKLSLKTSLRSGTYQELIDSIEYASHDEFINAQIQIDKDIEIKEKREKFRDEAAMIYDLLKECGGQLPQKDIIDRLKEEVSRRKAIDAIKVYKDIYWTLKRERISSPIIVTAKELI